MNTSRCAYCGGLAENPVVLGFAIDDDEEELAVRLPLCMACSQLWCPPPAAAHASSRQPSEAN
jgi:hypothetical protein